MAGDKGIDRLQQRKRALIVESDLNRLSLEAGWRDLRASTAWVKETAHIWRQFRPWLAVLAPMAGLLAARRARRPGGALSRLLSVVKWLPVLRNFWENFSSPKAGAASKKPAAS